VTPACQGRTIGLKESLNFSEILAVQGCAAIFNESSSLKMKESAKKANVTLFDSVF
jgi:hypothetical protein